MTDKLSPIKITVEGFAGQSKEDTIRAAAALADRIGIWVEVDVNGICVLTYPGASVEELLLRFHYVEKRKGAFASPKTPAI